MKTPVNFEIAKVLKEKGFDEPCNNWSYLDKNCMAMAYNSKNCVKIPTIADVVMWLYEKKGIWIEVIETDLFSKFFFQIKRKDNSRLKNGDFNSPTEAYLEAITYTLDNLL